jgi:hypothetical protein
MVAAVIDTENAGRTREGTGCRQRRSGRVNGGDPRRRDSHAELFETMVMADWYWMAA